MRERAAIPTLWGERARDLSTATPVVPRMGPPRVVILGGGFAGVHAGRALGKAALRNEIQLELITDENHFVFQPLLPEVAAGGIAVGNAVNPIREIVRGAKVRVASVLSVDLATQEVIVASGSERTFERVGFEHLIVATGRQTLLDGIPGARAHGLGMRDLGDAFRLRNHVIDCLERADAETDERERAARLTFVVAGGGFSGVETAGEIHELVSRSLVYYPTLNQTNVRFVVVHSGKELLPEMPQALGQEARRVLASRGIEIWLGARVTAVSRDFVHVKDGRAIATRTFISTVGSSTTNLVQGLLDDGLEEGIENGRATGRLRTHPDLRSTRNASVWAIGDCAAIPREGGFCPPTAQFAVRQATRCADNVLRAIRGQVGKPFQFRALGVLASLGQRRAVAQILGIKLTGFIAWVVWRTVYLLKLPSVSRKVRVALDWSLDLLFPRDITQLRTEYPSAFRRSHFEPGEMIVNAGDIARELYVVTSGEVEVLNALGGTITTLGPREIFGERALFEVTTRTASVRAKSAVDVLVLSRRDLSDLIEQMPTVAEHFEGLLRARYPEREGTLADWLAAPKQRTSHSQEGGGIATHLSSGQ